MNNRKIVLSFLFFFIISPLSFYAQQQKGFTITGNIKGLLEGERIVLKMQTWPSTGSIDIPVDSAIVKNGEFKIQGQVPDGPRMYWIWIRGDRYFYRIFIDNGQDIKLSYDNDINKNLHQGLDREITCIGSPTNDVFHNVWAMDEVFDLYNGGTSWMLKKIKDSVGYDRYLVGTAMRQEKAFNDAFRIRIASRTDPEFVQGSALFALYEPDSHSPFWDDMYNQMDEHLRNSVLGKKMQQRLQILVGKKMPDFSLPDVHGNQVKLNDQLAKNKLTLVRFWATKSYERSEFDQELRNMYQQYHNKGLEIIAISSDQYMDQWKETLGKEQYPWMNLVDLKGKTYVDTVYHELGNLEGPNTTNVLIDQHGKIIAWDVYGIRLQWYLDTYLNSGNQQQKSF